ncbi:general transcription factor 3C polypeptide 4-like [Glandiceps talaboti]
MAAPTVSNAVQLSHAICGSEVLCWSPEHKIAVATDRCVYIMDLQCSPQDTSKSFTFAKSVIASPKSRLDFDIDISEDKVLKQIDFQPCEALTNLMTDPTLTPDIRSDEVSTGMKMVKWSPLECDHLGRSVISYLTLDHHLMIYKHGRGLQWDEVADLSKLLNQKLKDDNFEYQNCISPVTVNAITPGVKTNEYMYATYKKRLYMLATVAMDWSDVYTEETNYTCTRLQSEEQSEREVDIEKKKRKLEKHTTNFVLLFTLMKSGHIVVWKFITPVVSEGCVSVHRVIKSDFDSPSTISWCRKNDHGQPSHHSGQYKKDFSQSSDQNGLLAVGDASGQVCVWYLNVDNEVTSRSSLMVCPDKDLLLPDMIAMQYQVDEHIYIMSVTKGCYLMAFMLKIVDNNIIILNKCIPASVHPMSITGLSFRHNLILTSSTDGTVNKTVVEIDNSTMSTETTAMKLTLNEKSPVKYHTITLSPNCVYAAIVTCGTTPTGEDSLEVNFVELKNKEDIVKEMYSFQGKLTNYLDSLEYIRQKMTTEMEINKEIQDFIQDTLKAEKQPILLKIQLFLMKMQLHLMKQMTVTKTIKMELEEPTQTKDVSLTEKNTTSLIQQISATEQSLIIQHAVSILEKWNCWKVSPAMEITNEERTIVLAIASWLNQHCGEASKATITSVYNVLGEKLSEVPSRELCPICHGILSVCDVKMVSCVDGHAFGRCCLTLTLCTDLPSRRCRHCEAPANKLQPSHEGTFLEYLLHQPCSFCDGELL